MRLDTQNGRLLRAYVRSYPNWIGGRDDGRRLNFSWHTQSQRSGELRDDHGFPCVSRRREGQQFHEYRLKDHATYERARLQVKSWGRIPIATLVVRVRPRSVPPSSEGGGV